MREQIMELLTINYVEAFISFVIIMSAAVVVKEGLERFCRAFDIELKWVKRREEMEKCQTKVSKAVDQIIARQDELENMQKIERDVREKNDQSIISAIQVVHDELTQMDENMKRREAEQRFRKLRYDILNFANKISGHERVSAELISQVYKEISEYDNLCVRYGFKNHQVTASVAVITAKYQEMLAEGKITNNDDDVNFDLYN